MRLPQLGKDWLVGELIKTLSEWLRQLEAADNQNFKRNRDVELARGTRLIVTGDDDLRYLIEVVAGTITATAL